MESQSLRVVTFNFLPIGYHLLTRWIAEAGHKHVLAVTTPGPKSRPTPTYLDVVNMAPRHVDVLITTRLRSVATPLIRELQPDLIACLSFPYRITPELCEIPRLGAVNIHPAVLPAYRGPNVMRPFYEGAPVFGATAHWIEPEFDTGRILSQKSAPMPKIIEPATRQQWGALIYAATVEGMERAIAGNPGVEQDDSLTTYAAPFTNDEKWLDWSEPYHVIRRKVIALNMGGDNLAKAMIDGRQYSIADVSWGEPSIIAPVGSVIASEGDQITIQAADGRVLATIIQEGN